MSAKRILICPLNLGLGHATRIIPVVQRLSELGHYVIIGAEGRAEALLKSEFTDLEFINFPDYGIRYSRYFSPVTSLFLQLPKLISGIFRENRRLKKIINEFQIDIVISDNRYGLYSKQASTVLITHQILIKPPSWLNFFDIWMWWIVTGWVQKFTYTWVPDRQNAPYLSGDLSHKYPLPENGKYIGLLAAVTDEVPEICDLLILISGPEPARTEFERIVLGQLKSLVNIKTVVLLGKPEGETEHSGSYAIFSHLSRKRISALIKGAGLIISRPGYTTVMEVAVLGKKALWVPTPGQTEQEYLCKYLAEQDMYRYTQQKKLDLSNAISIQSSYPQPKINDDKEKLFAALDLLLQ